MRTIDFAKVWRALEAWDRDRPRSLELAGCRLQLYMGAMAIPMLALRPHVRVEPAADRVTAWLPALQRFDLVLDCVSVGANYKLNRSETGEYVGRILPDALKFHAERILDLGPEAFEEIATLYLGLPQEGRTEPE